MKPSIEEAKKIADGLEVSLDHLAGEGINTGFDKKTCSACRIISTWKREKRTLFELMYTYIRDAKGRKAQVK